MMIRIREAVSDGPHRRRYYLPLRTGHKTAHLFTESTRYRYIEDLSAPKKWFKANVEHILAVYGAEHHILKEDLYFGKPLLHVVLQHGVNIFPP